MKVLVGCEYSGVVRDAFSRKGHDAWSCDLRPTESQLTKDESKHIEGDVLKIIEEPWDLFIAHPPCDFLSYAAMRVWDEPGRVFKRLESLMFFAKLWEANIDKICLENPRSCASPVIAKYTQEIQPYHWGDPFVKTTWLWLKGLPPLYWKNEDDLFEKQTSSGVPEPQYFKSGLKKVATDILGKGFSGEERSKERARFWPGIADAMAEQWG